MFDQVKKLHTVPKIVLGMFVLALAGFWGMGIYAGATGNFAASIVLMIMGLLPVMGICFIGIFADKMSKQD